MNKNEREEEIENKIEIQVEEFLEGEEPKPIVIEE